MIAGTQERYLDARQGAIRRHLHTAGASEQRFNDVPTHPCGHWEDFVLVACAEIRACGAGSLQIVRRLRAMIDNLLALLPPYRHAPLLQEAARLDAAIESAFRMPDELALAMIPDVQGLGGSARGRI